MSKYMEREVNPQGRIASLNVVEKVALGCPPREAIAALKITLMNNNVDDESANLVSSVIIKCLKRLKNFNREIFEEVLNAVLSSFEASISTSNNLHYINFSKHFIELYSMFEKLGKVDLMIKTGHAIAICTLRGPLTSKPKEESDSSISRGRNRGEVHVPLLLASKEMISIVSKILFKCPVNWSNTLEALGSGRVNAFKSNSDDSSSSSSPSSSSSSSSSLFNEEPIIPLNVYETSVLLCGTILSNSLPCVFNPKIILNAVWRAAFHILVQPTMMTKGLMMLRWIFESFPNDTIERLPNAKKLMIMIIDSIVKCPDSYERKCSFSCFLIIESRLSYNFRLEVFTAIIPDCPYPIMGGQMLTLLLQSVDEDKVSSFICTVTPCLLKVLSSSLSIVDRDSVILSALNVYRYFLLITNEGKLVKEGEVELCLNNLHSCMAPFVDVVDAALQQVEHELIKPTIVNENILLGQRTTLELILHTLERVRELE